MKIGFFNTAFPYKNPITNEILMETDSGGGVENALYNLTVKLAEKGHEIHVFTSSETRTESIENYANITIYRYKMNFKISRSPTSFDLAYKPLKLKLDLDIIHAHLGNLPAPIFGYWYSKKKKKPFVITHHGEYVGGFGTPIRRLGIFLHDIYFADHLLSNADAIIALSKESINESKFLKKYHDKIHIIPNGINLDEFDIVFSKEECRDKLDLNRDKKIILFVGSLTPIKAPDVLINAIKKVVEEVQDAFLIVVGEGKMKEELINQSKKLGIERNIRFTGFIKNTLEKAMYYKASDIFVLPSFSECYPVVLLESSACELPMVVSGLEYFKSIVEEGYNGLFTKTGDENDLAEKIIFLLENEDIRQKLGENAKEKVKRFTWKKIADETEKIYFNLIGK